MCRFQGARVKHFFLSRGRLPIKFLQRQTRELLWGGGKRAACKEFKVARLRESVTQANEMFHNGVCALLDACVCKYVHLRVCVFVHLCVCVCPIRDGGRVLGAVWLARSGEIQVLVGPPSAFPDKSLLHRQGVPPGRLLLLLRIGVGCARALPQPLSSLRKSFPVPDISSSQASHLATRDPERE